MQREHAKGNVIKAFGNLLEVTYIGDIMLGESCFVSVEGQQLQAEVIQVCPDHAKLQVFDSTSGVKVGDKVVFSNELIEAELGPGLLSSLYDGLQNPLKIIARDHGIFLKPGSVAPSIDREKKWKFCSVVNKGDKVVSGSPIGFVKEGNLNHKIFVPFSLNGKFTVFSIKTDVELTVLDTVAVLEDEKGKHVNVTMLQRWPIKKPLLNGKKVSSDSILSTGCRSIDTQFPIAKGGSFCMPGPFGAGKTVLQQHIAKYCSVDVVIFAACGERAGEVVELIDEFPKLVDPKTSRPLIERTILICNTSSMPVSSRESSIYIAITIGEYYRQMGLDVLVLADSTSRWAQAMREMSSRLEEIPGDEAFPVYLASKISELYQRSGSIMTSYGDNGSLTVGGAVSPAGGNFDEPVTQATLSVVGTFLGLSKMRSDSRRYPAIDPLSSWSKYMHIAINASSRNMPEWGSLVYNLGSILHKGYEISKRIEVVGEDGIPLEEFLIYLKAELYDTVYLQQNSFDVEDAYCSTEKQLKLISIIKNVLDNDFNSFVSHDECRGYFLKLQSVIKELNFMNIDSENWDNHVVRVYDMLSQAQNRS